MHIYKKIKYSVVSLFLYFELPFFYSTASKIRYIDKKRFFDLIEGLEISLRFFFYRTHFFLFHFDVFLLICDSSGPTLFHILTHVEERNESFYKLAKYHQWVQFIANNAVDLLDLIL